jgi:hypothetical protein
MELISRILDGSIPYSLKGLPQGRSFFGGRVSQDDKIDRLEEVALLEACTRKQLREFLMKHYPVPNFIAQYAANMS